MGPFATVRASNLIEYAAPVADNAGGLDPTLTALQVAERGFVFGSMVLGLGPEGAKALAPPARERCVAALTMLARVPRDQKAARIALLARELSAAFPPWVEIVHPSWLAKPLAAEPSDFLPALVVGAPPGVRQAVGEVMQARGEGEPASPVTLAPELAAELRRVIFAPLRHIAASANGPLALLLDRTSAGMLSELRRLGARSLGASLASSPPEVVARAMAAVGSAYASDLREAAQTVDTAQRREGEADVKAASAEPVSSAEERLEKVGFHALKRLARGESPEVKRALALRLPRSLGKELLSEAPEPPAEPRRKKR
jgi:hypothetical protein